MEAFSILDCTLYWDTRKEIPKKDSQEIKEQLKTLSVTIGKALLFLKEAALDGNEPTINFLMGDNSQYKLSLWLTNSSMSVQEGEEAIFEMNISDNETVPAVAHFYSEKFRIVLGVFEEEEHFLKFDTIK